MMAMLSSFAANKVALVHNGFFWRGPPPVVGRCSVVTSVSASAAPGQHHITWPTAITVASVHRIIAWNVVLSAGRCPGVTDDMVQLQTGRHGRRSHVPTYYVLFMTNCKSTEYRMVFVRSALLWTIRAKFSSLCETRLQKRTERKNTMDE